MLSIIKFIGFVLATIITVPAIADDMAEWPSIINLIATPERYHGKEIFIQGWVDFSHENHSLCLSNSIPSSRECIWIELSDAKDKNNIEEMLLKHNLKIISLRGIYDMHNTGHLGGWSGAIHHITEIYSNEPPKQIE